MRRPNRRLHRSALICALLVGMFSSLWPAALLAAEPAPTVEFNSAFLRSAVDVGMFAEGNPVPPGTYRVDLYTNGQWKGRSDVRLEQDHPGARVARPCFDLKLLDTFGLDTGPLARDTRRALAHGGQCGHLEELLPQAEASFDSGALRLDVSAPQAILQHTARGYVSPEFWDEGITAATLQYDFNAYRSELPGHASYTSKYLGLRGGLNLGPWRLRYRSAATWDEHNTLHYQNSAIYAERALPRLRSNLLLGEASTNGQIFDSISFRGIQLASDDRMYADTERGFAPVVRGIANSNARVRISQRGTLIYETTVPPGPFTIDDLYPNGSGGDLQVTVTEADGSMHNFTVSYAATAELLRPGVTRYSVTAGEYRDPMISDGPTLAMGTWRHGFSNALTAYAGGVAASGYTAAAGGLAFNTRFGALAADITQARTRTGTGLTFNGNSLRLSYAKILPVIDTNITLASYRYSSRGYFDPADAFMLHEHAPSTQRRVDMQLQDRRRNRLVLSATQSLPGRFGSLSVSASSQNYWARSGADTEYVLSYNNQWGRASVGFSASRTQNVWTRQADNQFTLSLSVPLGDSGHTPQLSTHYTNNRDNRSLQAALSGSAGEQRQYRYNAFASIRDNKDGGHHTTAGASGYWAAPYASIGASASTGQGYRQYGVSASGGVVAYRGGVTLAPALGDTIGIVEARHAGGARVANYSGVRLDHSGLAVVPYLTPYRRNAVEIDPKGISTDVQLQSTGQHVAPTAGAVSLLRFETDTGYSVLLEGRLADGSPLPFAAAILDGRGQLLGYVAQGGQAILRVAEPEGTLRIRWGEGPGQHCVIHHALGQNPHQDTLGYRPLHANCIADE